VAKARTAKARKQLTLGLDLGAVVAPSATMQQPSPLLAMQSLFQRQRTSRHITPALELDLSAVNADTPLPNSARHGPVKSHSQANLNININNYGNRNLNSFAAVSLKRARESSKVRAYQAL